MSNLNPLLSHSESEIEKFIDENLSFFHVSTKTYKKVGKAIEVGKQPNWVAISHNGATAYVSNSADNTVSVIKITPAQ